MNSTYTYIIKTEKEHFENCLQEILNDKNNNLIGNLDKDKFKITFSWILKPFFRHIERDPAYIDGKIINEKESVKVEIKLRANSLLSVYSYFFTFFSFVCLFLILIINSFSDDIYLLYLFISIGILSILFGEMLKSILKAKFEREIKKKFKD